MSTGKRVLVVDDDGPIREALAEVLAKAGFELDQAENGRKALQVLHDRVQPDVILLDLTMPVMSGLEFRQAQLADPELASIPVVVMSAVDMSGIHASAKLTKPCDVRRLVDTVVRIVEDRTQSKSPTRQPSGSRGSRR